MTDKKLSDLLSELKPIVLSRGRVSVRLGGIHLFMEHSRQDQYLDNITSVNVPNDRRRDFQVLWVYNARQLTLSFASLLHELGHIFNDHAPVIHGELRRNTDPYHVVMEQELEAWYWARTKWHLAPIRRRWPSELEMYFIEGYGNNRRPYLNERHEDLLNLMSVEEELLYRGFSHRTKAYTGKERIELDPYTDGIQIRSY